MASLQFAFLLVICAAGQSLAADQSRCSVQVDVTYTEGRAPTVACSNTCDAASNDLWFEGSAYQRVPRLTSEFSLMVKLNYRNGALTGCSLVTYQTVEEVSAELKELMACMGIEEEVTTTDVPSTTLAPTAETSTLAPTTVTTTVPPTTTIPTPPCPQGFTHLLNSCYLLSSGPLTRNYAMIFCQNAGASLAFIKSKEEQEAVKSILTTHTYIGINDIKEEGVYTSMTGDPVVYTNWNAGEPNGLRTENCVAMRQNLNYGWNDVSCAKEFVALCKTAAAS